MEIGLAMSWRDPSAANIAFRNRLEAVVYAVMELEKLLVGWFYYKPKGWAMFVDELRIFLKCS